MRDPCVRMRVERTFAVEGQFKRLLATIEHIQSGLWHEIDGVHVINLRKFCGT